ncbi:heterotrimeric G-protein alpha subunit [Lactarius tabidus]
MGLGILASWEEWRAAKRSKACSDEIDRQIKEEAKTFKRCDVLLMGINDATTLALFRQMKILCNDGYSHKELLNFRLSVWRYFLETSRRIVQDLRNEGLEPANHANKANCKHILVHPTDTDHPEFCFQPGFAEAVQELWADDIVLSPFIAPLLVSSLTPSRSEQHLASPHAHRITSKDYIPSNSDILRAPAQVQMGATETHLFMGQLSIHLYHAIRLGSGWRKKRIYFSENTTSIIFCTSLPDYDRQDEHGHGLLTKSLDLFESVIDSRWFVRTSVILFLTGLEEFKVKLLKVPLENYFPEYTGGADVNKAARYILWQFMQANRARLNVYSHITDVFDASSIRLVFVTVKETILHSALKNSGII